MNTKTVLTGITTTGSPHLGNYSGAIKPAIVASRAADVQSYFFLADYHALIKCSDPVKVKQSSLEIAATWLALGLDIEHVTFYRQSDVPEVTELNWLLMCMCSKGLLNRAHAYKAAVAVNTDQECDADKGVTMGLFNYPVLMAADILMFNGSHVPVGKDQVQHIEMARDMAARFNHHYGEHFVLPEAVVGDDSSLLAGLDGRKMSKSYDNTIPLFLPEKKFRKAIMKIITNSLEPGEPKDPDSSAVFLIYKAFATPEQSAIMRESLVDGLGWGDAKQQLFELLNTELAEPREKYFALLSNPAQVEEALQFGAQRARVTAQTTMLKLRSAVGIEKLH